MNEGWVTSKDDMRRLSELLDLLRAKGVREFGGFGVAVKLGPPVESAPADSIVRALESAAEPTCRCGHEMANHQGGFCLAGCDAEKCLPESV